MASGQLTTFSATLPQKRVVSDRIIMADPMSIAGINALGLDNESKFQFVNTPGVVYEWLEDTYAARSDVVVSGLAADSTTTTYNATDGTKFVIGDVVLFELEYVWVSGVAANVVTIVRNYGGTQAVHANGVTGFIVASNRLQGAAADTFIWTQPTTGFNYMSIFQRTIEISRSDARIKQYGIANVVDREIDKKMKELTMLLNLSFYHGQRKTGSVTTPRAAGGLKTFITTNKNTLTGTPPLTQKHIEDELADCWTAGGNPNLILCNQWPKRKIADFYSGYVRTERSETMGGVTIDKIMMPLGVEVDVLVDRHCPADQLYILDTNFIGGITLQEFFEESLGKTKDTQYYGQVVGEYGLVVAYEKAHSYIESFSTTS